jgi:hypothetical protein
VVDVSDDTVVRAWPALPSALTLRRNTTGGRITFDERGATTNASTLTVCDSRDESDDATAREKQASAIVISAVGRVRNGVDANNDGIVEGGSGNITCP